MLHGDCVGVIRQIAASGQNQQFLRQHHKSKHLATTVPKPTNAGLVVGRMINMSVLHNVVIQPTTNHIERGLANSGQGMAAINPGCIEAQTVVTSVVRSQLRHVEEVSVRGALQAAFTSKVAGWGCRCVI